MKKLFLSAMILLNNSVMCMQSSIKAQYIQKAHELCDLEKLPKQIRRKIASYFRLKDLVNFSLASKELYEACTDEEQYSIAIQVRIDHLDLSKFGKVSEKFQELLKDPSVICFAQDCEAGFNLTPETFIYAREYTDPNQSLRFFPMQLIELPKNIFSLHILIKPFPTIPRYIGQLTKLETLVLRTGLTDLPNSIAHMINLEDLAISNNKFKQLPEVIYKLRNLETIRANYNEITFIPCDISLLTKLQMLNLMGNALTEIPPSIWQLTQLTHLNLSHNNLTDLPNTIGGTIHSLRSLYISNNKFKEPPKVIRVLTYLEILDISHNGILDIEQCVILLNLPASCKITYAPQNI